MKDGQLEHEAKLLNRQATSTIVTLFERGDYAGLFEFATLLGVVRDRSDARLGAPAEPTAADVERFLADIAPSDFGPGKDEPAS